METDTGTDTGTGEEVDLDDEDQGGGEPKLWNGDKDVLQGDDGKLTLSQDRMSAIMAKEKREGKRSGENNLLKQLGAQDLNEAKAIFEAGKKALGSKKKDEDDGGKDDEQTAQDRAEAAREKREAKIEKVSAKLERKLLGEPFNAPADSLSHLVRIANIEELLEGDDDDLTDEARRLKEEVPQLFAKPESKKDDKSDEDNQDKKDKKPPASDPGRGPKVKSNGNATSTSKAREILERRHPQTAKK